MNRRHRLIALLTGASLPAIRPGPQPINREAHSDPYVGALTAPDLPQQLRDKGAL